MGGCYGTHAKLFIKIIEAQMNKLEQLEAMTAVVADTGDIATVPAKNLAAAICRQIHNLLHFIKEGE